MVNPFEDATYYTGRDREVVSLNPQPVEFDETRLSAQERLRQSYNPLEEASLLSLGVDVTKPPHNAPGHGCRCPYPRPLASPACVRAWMPTCPRSTRAKLDSTKAPVESGAQSVTHTVRQPSKVRLVGRIVGPRSRFRVAGKSAPCRRP